MWQGHMVQGYVGCSYWMADTSWLCEYLFEENSVVATMKFNRRLLWLHISLSISKKMCTICRYLIGVCDCILCSMIGICVRIPNQCTGMVEDFRSAVFSLSLLRKQVRHTLCVSHYIDFDMVNAHPDILYQLLKKCCPDGASFVQM